MRAPRNRGTPIDADRRAAWVERFAGYDPHVSTQRLDAWLGQFADRDKDLAARVLDAVEYFRRDHLANAFRSILGALPGWHRNPARRQGRWRFVAFSTHPGESGDSMLSAFRVANNLTGKRFSELFAWKADLLRQDLGPDDTVVFVDDFAGTGDQAIDAWNESLGELLPRRPRTFLVLVAAVEDAAHRINAETKLTVRMHRHLRPRDNFFGAACNHFSHPEKQTVLTYCQRADRQNPRGYSNCGLLLVMAHRCPNNSAAILHARGDFEGLFRR